MCWEVKNGRNRFSSFVTVLNLISYASEVYERCFDPLSSKQTVNKWAMSKQIRPKGYS